MACFICPLHGPVCDNRCPSENLFPCAKCPRVNQEQKSQHEVATKELEVDK